MEWTCNEDCWCHIPVQKERGPPCYQCVLRNCSFTSPMPVPSAPPLLALLDHQEPSPAPHLHEESNTPPHLYYSHPYEEPSAPPHQHAEASTPSHQCQGGHQPSSSSPPPLLPPKRNKLSIRGSWCPSASNRLCLSSDPAPPDAGAAVRHTQEYSPSPPAAPQAGLCLSADPAPPGAAAAMGRTQEYSPSPPAQQARLELQVPVLSGRGEELQGQSEDGNVKKNEPPDVSGLLRELLQHDEYVTASQGSWALHEESTSSPHSENSFLPAGSDAAHSSDDNQDYRRKRRSRVRLSGFGLETNVLSQSHSAQAHHGSLDEEAFRRINRIHRRESWKCAQQRHMLDNNKTYI